MASRNRSVGPVRAIFSDLIPAARKEIPAWMRKPEPGETGPTIPPETAAALLHATSKGRSTHRGKEGEAASGTVQVSEKYPPPSSIPSPQKRPLSDPILDARMQSAALAAEASESWLPPPGAVDPGPPPEPPELDELRAAIASLHQAKTEILQQSAPELLQLAKLIAERVLETEALKDTGLATRLVREGLHALDHGGRVAVILGPGFQTQASQLQTDLEGDGIRCEVQIHEHLSPFACQIRSELGAVDESLETRLDNVLAAILELEEGS